MAQEDQSIKTSLQHAVQYTVYISLLYIIYKFFDNNSPQGVEFISYIIPMLLSGVVVIVFPLLFAFFYFKGGNTDTIFKKDDPQTREINNQEMLRQYHSMLKEGIITQEEFDSIKKRYLKDLKKD
ncbi:MAG: SHOCT domain-containing protein [Campylobacterota bacterium]|nr:SHOCT domain-containing protein [Campylobacterota bacterium]